MKICFIGPGNMSIPPNGWGAVESIIWDYYCNLKNNNDVVIIVGNDNNDVIDKCNSDNFDIVHVMYDDYIAIVPYLLCKKILYTSHFAYITHANFENKCESYFKNIFLKVIENKHITINAISNEIKQKYISYGFPQENINVIHNGAREDLFIYKQSPMYSNKSIYLAKIEERKKQYLYQSIDNIDFVGNYQDSNFDTTKSNYLGEWSKNVLYNNLSDYANLILLSDGEADSLVVKEALVCGLGIVVSECASANLNEKEFIDIIPNGKLNDIDYVSNIIECNRQKSLQNREIIRKYGIEKFSWKNIIKQYQLIINKNC